MPKRKGQKRLAHLVKARAALQKKRSEHPVNDHLCIDDDDDDEDELSGNGDYAVYFSGDDSRLQDDPDFDPAIQCSIKWRSSMEAKRSRSVYMGDSRTSQWRKNKSRKEHAKAASSCQKITSFFGKCSRNGDEDSDNDGDNGNDDADDNAEDTEHQPDLFTVPQAISNLHELTSLSHSMATDRRLSHLTKFDFIRLMAVEQYLIAAHDFQKIQASVEVAERLFPESNAQYTGRKIRDWSMHFLKVGKLPEHKQGKHAKTVSLMNDEDIQKACRAYLRCQRNDTITSMSFMKWVNESLHLDPNVNLPASLNISERSATRWLHQLNYNYDQYKKGSYVDGHERPDVVEYRNAFLDRMAEFERRFVKYSGEDMMTETPPDLVPGESRLVLVTHDESCFSSHDGKRTIWMDEERRPLRPKGDGKSIMVSEFLCECHGQMQLPELNETSPSSTVEIITPGKNADGYWTNKNLIDRIKKVIPIFEELHPNCTALFMFDNSQNHHALAPDALRASVLNVSDGGKNVIPQRSGWYLNENNERVIQEMQHGNGVQKGLRTILMERGLWSNMISRTGARDLLKINLTLLSSRNGLKRRSKGRAI